MMILYLNVSIRDRISRRDGLDYKSPETRKKIKNSLKGREYDKNSKNKK